MNTGRRKLYILSFGMPALLLPLLFLPTAYCRPVSAAVLAVLAAATLLLIKKRRTPSLHYREVAGLLAVAAVVYLTLTYLAGIRVGFYRSAVSPSVTYFALFVLPVAAIIVATELVRTVLLAQAEASVSAIAYVTCILADLLLGQGVSLVGHLNGFLDVMGLTLFPAVTSNLLCHYLSARYGAMPVIVYRLTLTLPAFLMPVAPAISDALNAFLLVVLPLIVQAFIALLYEKKVKRATHRRSDKWTYVGFGALLAFMAAFVMLVSGQFRYSVLVIATPSMTGELNVGDVLLYEAYDGEVLEEGQVVVFSTDDRTLIVHRVVDRQSINGEIRYITKGDANDETDSGYITAAELRGVALYKVPHVGHPSLWLRNLFS